MSKNYMNYEEFEFFNSQFGLISQENYIELSAKQKKNGIAYFCDETFDKKHMFLEFNNSGITYCSFNSITFDYKLINNVNYYKRGLFFTYDIDENKKSLYSYIDNRFSDYNTSNYDYNYIGKIFNNELEFKKHIFETFINNALIEEKHKEVLDFFGFTNERHIRLINTDRYFEIKIVKDVIEIRKNNINYRLVLFEEFYNENGIFRIKIYAEDNPIYNYMDKDRIFIESNKGHNYFFVMAMETNNYEDDELVINRKLMGVIGINASKTIGNNSDFISPQIFNFFKDRMSFYYENNNNNIINIKEQKVFEKYIELLDDGKTVKINNILISNNMIKFTEENFVLCLMRHL